MKRQPTFNPDKPPTWQLTRDDAQEVLHKIGILLECPDLQADYGILAKQAHSLYESIPRKGGEWKIPDELLATVVGEMTDHVKVLRDIASSGCDGDKGQALRIAKQAMRFERALAALGPEAKP